jgi:nitrite reductase/ring-hydroxylating ferredoxin subunit
MGAQLNWCPTLAKVSDLPQQDGVVSLIDTNLPTLKNGATNPTGAVSVAKLNGNTYCFSVNCPQCKIPLTKAMLLDGPPRLACTFCKTTYDLKSGQKVETAPEVTGGMLGGLVKNLFSAQEGGPLPLYKLGEKAGKVLIAFD